VILVQFAVQNIVLTMSAAEGQDRAMRKMLICNGNKSTENKLAPYLKRGWETSYEENTVLVQVQPTSTKIILR
jgi:hypothetical protein